MNDVVRVLDQDRFNWVSWVYVGVNKRSESHAANFDEAFCLAIFGANILQKDVLIRSTRYRVDGELTLTCTMVNSRYSSTQRYSRWLPSWMMVM